jgi:hypothetical protein
MTGEIADMMLEGHLADDGEYIGYSSKDISDLTPCFCVGPKPGHKHCPCVEAQIAAGRRETDNPVKE